MPLFGRAPVETTTTTPATVEEPRRSSTLFGRRRASSPVTDGTVNGSPRRGLLHRSEEDGSIVAARERVLAAEASERDADRALFQARAAVREAREHVKRLEREAAEE